MEILTTALKEHFEPTPNVITQRFYFHQRNQKANESVAEFIAELRKLARDCEFGDSLNVTLRDRLVGGLKSSSIQKKLLTMKAPLTFAEACSTAKSMEAAESPSVALEQVGLPCIVWSGRSTRVTR